MVDPPSYGAGDLKLINSPGRLSSRYTTVDAFRFSLSLELISQSPIGMSIDISGFLYLLDPSLLVCSIKQLPASILGGSIVKLGLGEGKV
jgi:hypothetical protein